MAIHLGYLERLLSVLHLITAAQKNAPTNSLGPNCSLVAEANHHPRLSMAPDGAPRPYDVVLLGYGCVGGTVHSLARS